MLLEDPSKGDQLFHERPGAVRGEAGYLSALQSISRLASGKIGGQGGTLSTVERAKIEANLGMSEPDTLPLFRCVALTNAFLETCRPEAFLSACQCFQPKLDRVADDPAAGAAWGTLAMHAVPSFTMMDTEVLPPDALQSATDVRDCAMHLAAKGPESDNALIMLGAVETVSGNHGTAINALQQAASANPAKPPVNALLS